MKNRDIICYFCGNKGHYKRNRQNTGSKKIVISPEITIMGMKMIIKQLWKIFPPGENQSKIKTMDGKPWKQCEQWIMWSTGEKFTTTSENTRGPDTQYQGTIQSSFE